MLLCIFAAYQTPQCVVVEPTYAYPGPNAIHHPGFHGGAPLNSEMHGFEMHDFCTRMHVTYDTITPIGTVDISENMPPAHDILSLRNTDLSNSCPWQIQANPDFLESGLCQGLGMLALLAKCTMNFSFKFLLTFAISDFGFVCG